MELFKFTFHSLYIDILFGFDFILCRVHRSIFFIGKRFYNLNTLLLNHIQKEIAKHTKAGEKLQNG